MNDTQIEALLRQAPRPPAPAGLKQQLLADIHPPQPLGPVVAPMEATPFWRRWFPALAFGVLLFGCLIVLGMQTSQLLELRRQNEQLRAATANLDSLRQENAKLQQSRAASQETERLRSDNEELLKLRAEVAQLRGRTQELSVLRAENQRLQAERDAAAAQAGVAAEEDPFALSQEKALSVKCISNIKQIGLAARMWANDHQTDVLPSDFVTIKNELITPRVLTCPADTARARADSWQQFDGSSVSYEMLSPGASEREPNTVYVRCVVHGHIGLTDGSAQMNRPNLRFITVDGKVRLEGAVKAGPDPAKGDR